MNANGASNVNMGDGMGFNPAAMMAGMAMGGAMGQNFAGMMNNVMSGVNQAAQTDAVPPPIPTVSYYVAINGQAAGPFDIATLKQMAIEGRVTATSLVWKSGMTNWVSINSVDELQHIIAVIPPVPPA